VTQVAIIDSGGANIASLLYAFARLKIDATLTSDATVIQSADHVLLPGVGAAKNAMTRLADAGLLDVIRQLTQPVLGICLGMQLLCDGSEEEDVECLGIIPGTAGKLPVAENFPVPNMGWCATSFRSDDPALNGIEDRSFFYYLHSYALPVTQHTIATAEHSDEFSSMTRHNNFLGAQFHPERSSNAGAQLLHNFLEST
jgi:glutamine amidotransferase